MPRPRVFIGSSSESLAVAQAINQVLARDADAVVWPHAFPLGKNALDSLLLQVNESDFAVFVMTPDDITKSRGKESGSPRDNVVFELGLFTGRLGANRCYGIHPWGADIKYPTDLLGIKTAGYNPSHTAGLVSAVEPACNEIRQKLKELGVFARDSTSTFCARIAGFWWEVITPAKVSSIGFVEFSPDGLGGVSIKGWAHKAEGPRVADWWTESCSVDPRNRKLFYTWKGHYLDKPHTSFEGYGDFLFDAGDGQMRSGHGFFAEIDTMHLEQTTKRTGTIIRCTQAEIDVMQSGNQEKMEALIRKKLGVKKLIATS